MCVKETRRKIKCSVTLERHGRSQLAEYIVDYFSELNAIKAVNELQLFQPKLVPQVGSNKKRTSITNNSVLPS